MAITEHTHTEVNSHAPLVTPLLSLAAVAALALSLSTPALAQNQAASAPTSKMPSTSGSGMGMGMSKGEKMHHERALEMAKAEIAHGKSAELKAMSRKIITAQQKEIAQLDKWMAANK